MADDADGDDVGGAAHLQKLADLHVGGPEDRIDLDRHLVDRRVGIRAGGFAARLRLGHVLGSADMQISQLLKMGRGAVVELDRKVGEPVNIMANGQLVARGEVVVEDKLGVAMTEILKSNWS